MVLQFYCTYYNHHDCHSDNAILIMPFIDVLKTPQLIAQTYAYTACMANFSNTFNKSMVTTYPPR